MNTKSKLALSLGLLAAPLALLAMSPEKSYVDAYRGRSDIPAPLSVVSPELDARFAGQLVKLEFVVDTTGTPTAIKAVTPGVDAELLASVSAAVAQWKFSPALANGLPVARKVVLPVSVVANFDPASVLAMK